MRKHLLKIAIYPLLACCLVTACTKNNQQETKMKNEPRIIDEVIIGNQESELEHQLDSDNSRTGFHNGGNWRDASGDNGGYFQYTLQTDQKTDLVLWVRYWGNDQGRRVFNISIDDNVIARENLGGRWNRAAFYTVEYHIPAEIIKGKKSVIAKFQSSGNNYAGGIYGLRLLENDGKTTKQQENISVTLDKFEVAEQFGPYRFIGKTVYARAWEESSDKIYAALWENSEWIFDILDNLKEYAADDTNNHALFTWEKFDDKTKSMGYTIGRFMKADTPVPSGLDFYDIPVDIVAKGFAVFKLTEDNLFAKIEKTGSPTFGAIAQTKKYEETSWKWTTRTYPNGYPKKSVPDNDGKYFFGTYVPVRPVAVSKAAKPENR